LRTNFNPKAEIKEQAGFGHYVLKNLSKHAVVGAL
jgi:hypothetical protein